MHGLYLKYIGPHAVELRPKNVHVFLRLDLTFDLSRSKMWRCDREAVEVHFGLHLKQVGSFLHDEQNHGQTHILYIYNFIRQDWQQNKNGRKKNLN